MGRGKDARIKRGECQGHRFPKKCPGVEDNHDV